MENAKLQLVFTNETFFHNMLSCNECGNFFKKDIYVNENQENLCEKCAEPVITNESFLQKNIQLMKIINFAKLACEFYKQEGGCSQVLPYKEMEAHQKICQYRTIKCSLVKTCKWIGTLGELNDHINEIHKDLICEKNPILFRQTMDKDFQIFRQIVVGSKWFLLKMTYEWGSKMIYYIIYRYSEENEGQLNFTIEFTCNKTKNKYKLSHKVFVGLYENFFENTHCFSVSVENMHSLVNMNDYLDVCFMVTGDSFQDEFRSELLEALECPVCKEIMSDIVYQCEVGHSVCKNCKKASCQTVCPTCRGSMGTYSPSYGTRKDIRNFLVEGLTNLMLPCLYKESGCRNRASLRNIRKHENECIFKNL